MKKEIKMAQKSKVRKVKAIAKTYIRGDGGEGGGRSKNKDENFYKSAVQTDGQTNINKNTNTELLIYKS